MEWPQRLWWMALLVWFWVFWLFVWGVILSGLYLFVRWLLF